MSEKTYITIEQRFYNELLTGKVMADVFLNLIREKEKHYSPIDVNEVRFLYAAFCKEGDEE